jgi:hypothetical protein
VPAISGRTVSFCDGVPVMSGESHPAIQLAAGLQ